MTNGSIDENWEYEKYRIEWGFKLGYIGDSEGRTWAKELKEETPFSSREAAERYRDSHPDVEFDTVWNTWRPKYCNGQFEIERRMVKVSAQTHSRLEENVESMMKIVDASARIIWNDKNPEGRSYDDETKFSKEVYMITALLKVIDRVKGEHHDDN